MAKPFEVTFENGGAAYFFGAPENEKFTELLEGMIRGMSRALEMPYLPGVVIHIGHGTASIEGFAPKALMAMTKLAPVANSTEPLFLSVVAYNDMLDAMEAAAMHYKSGEFPTAAKTSRCHL